jgi:hypothetical protein
VRRHLQDGVTKPVHGRDFALALID